MDYYFLIITIIDVFVLGIMCILTKYNETLNKQRKQWFIRSFVLIIVISVLEVVTVAVDKGPVSLRWLNIIANYLGFGLTPAVPIFLAHVTWLCVSLLAILFLTYCNGMWQQLDGLTGLLNQNSYLNKTDALSQNGTLIVFDIDDFKKINDNYGHLIGDQCLKEIAASIKKAYSKDGFCYRIGGDEFFVLLKENADAEADYRKLINELNSRRKMQNYLPYVSIGSA